MFLFILHVFSVFNFNEQIHLISNKILIATITVLKNKIMTKIINRGKFIDLQNNKKK